MSADIFSYGFDIIDQIAERLRKNEVGIFPCDTIYGLCSVVSEENRERIFEIKERPQNKNLIQLMSKEQVLSSHLIVPDDILSRWPAPFTAILANPDGSTVAVRVPSDPFLSSLIEKSGPIFSTSVNISGHPSLQEYNQIEKVFGSRVDFIVEKKNLVPGLSSTLIDATKKPYRIIRQGAYSF